MQTVELKFTKLDKLPIPESLNEFLFIETLEGRQFCFRAQRKYCTEQDCFINEYQFDISLDASAKYCHLKVTAATEPTFKVGDRVIYNVSTMVSNTGTILEIDGDYCLVKLAISSVKVPIHKLHHLDQLPE